MSIKLENVSISVPIFKGGEKFLKKSIFSTKGMSYKCLIDELNLNLSSGSSYGLIGENGSGKTTLLKLMMGIYAPTKGDVIIEGDVSGTISTLGGYNPELTVKENIILRALSINSDFKFATEITREVIDFAEIDVDESTPFKHLSNGNQLKIGFSFATAFNAENLLLDEIVTVGDRRFISKAKKRLKDYLDMSKLFLLSTHNESLLKDFCKLAIVMRKGRVIYSGDIDNALKLYHSDEYFC